MSDVISKAFKLPAHQAASIEKHIASVMHHELGLNGKLPPSVKDGEKYGQNSKTLEALKRRKRIFETIQTHGPISRADIAARLTDIKPACISDHLSMLRQDEKINNETRGIWEVVA